MKASQLGAEHTWNPKLQRRLAHSTRATLKSQCTLGLRACTVPANAALRKNEEGQSDIPWGSLELAPHRFLPTIVCQRVSHHASMQAIGLGMLLAMYSVDQISSTKTKFMFLKYVEIKIMCCLFKTKNLYRLRHSLKNL